MKIEGVPEGYEILRLGKPRKGDICVALNGTIHEWKTNADLHYTILRKLPEPLQLREGAWYERRDGSIDGPAERRDPMYALKWSVGESCHREDGRALISGRDSPSDLIREVPPPKPAIDPGEGWRLLEDGELIDTGDERWNGYLWTVEGWVGIRHKVGQPIRRRIAPKYRPFANAAEFEPHRERWMKIKSSNVFGKAGSYGDYGIYAADGSFKTYEEALVHVTFEDGTPCGVKE